MTTENPTPELPAPPPPLLAESSAPPDVPAPVAAGAPDEDGPEASEPQDGAVGAADVEAPEPSKLQWYVVKVQSNREESIREAIERRVKIEGLQEAFGEIVIPTEKVSEMRKGKRYIKSRKLLPGYLMVHVEFNEHMLYLFRETSGVGDFVGAGMNKKPLPMSENEIKKWIGKKDDDTSEVKAPDASPYNEGDRVKVKDGMFSGMEGVVKQVLAAKGAVTVELTIFGRPVPVELEYWQVDFA